MTKAGRSQQARAISFVSSTAGGLLTTLLAAVEFGGFRIGLGLLIGDEGGDGRIVAGSTVVIGSVQAGVAIRDGIPDPDISTPDAFCETVGVTMGPDLFMEDPRLAYGPFTAMAVTYVIMIFTIMPLARHTQRHRHRGGADGRRTL